MGITVLHGHDQQGTTAQRPTNAENGFAFFDTTLTCTIFYDADNSVWRDAQGRDVSNGIFDLAGAGAPSDGTGGTGVGVAATGCVYTRTSNGARYRNDGTSSSPTWTAL